MTYTASGRDGVAGTLIPGEGPPRFADGTSIDPKARVVWTIEADAWEDALRRYHELQG